MRFAHTDTANCNESQTREACKLGTEIVIQEFPALQKILKLRNSDRGHDEKQLYLHDLSFKKTVG